MNKIFQIQPYIFKELLRAKLTNIYRTLFDKVVNFYIWAICTLLISGHLMQALGMAKDYGAFQLGGVVACVGLFELYGNAVTFVSDLEGDKSIVYYLTLPSSALSVLLSYICYYALVSASMALFLLPLAKLILWNEFSLINVLWLKLLFFIVLNNFVYATATILASALIPSMDKFDKLWNRFVYPLWIFGGFQFSWISVNGKWPLFSYIMLLNPVTYTTEGIRASLIGQEGNISYWICCLALIMVGIIVSFWAFKALKKRLDFVE